MAVGRYDEDATAGLYACGSLLEQADLPAASRIPALHFGYRDRVPQAVPKLAAWIRRHRVEAVIGNWSHLAGMVRAAGCRVPADVACVNLCLSEPHPEMAGVWLDHHAVGRRAAEMVALNLKTGRRGVSAAPRSTYLAGKWLDGATAPAR